MKIISFRSVGLCLIAILAVSCVSKKEYWTLAHEKKTADRFYGTAIEKWEDDFSLLQKEYNRTHTQLSESNAEKDRDLSELTSRLNTLTAKERSLSAQVARLNNQINTGKTSDKEQLERLQKQLKATSAECDALRKELSTLRTDSEWEKRKLTNENNTIKNNILYKEAENLSLRQQIDTLSTTISRKEMEMEAKDEEIEKLTNQVNLLRKELGY